MATVKINPGVPMVPAPVPAGTYDLVLTRKMSVTKSKSSDNDTIPLEWEIFNPVEVSGNKVLGRKLFDTLVLTPSAEYKIKQVAVFSGKYTEQELNENGGAIDLERFPVHQTKIRAKVGTKVGEQDGEKIEKNVIKTYAAID